MSDLLPLAGGTALWQRSIPLLDGASVSFRHWNDCLSAGLDWADFKVELLAEHGENIGDRADSFVRAVLQELANKAFCLAEALGQRDLAKMAVFECFPNQAGDLGNCALLLVEPHVRGRFEESLGIGLFHINVHFLKCRHFPALGVHPLFYRPYQALRAARALVPLLQESVREYPSVRFLKAWEAYQLVASALGFEAVDFPSLVAKSRWVMRATEVGHLLEKVDEYGAINRRQIIKKLFRRGFTVCPHGKLDGSPCTDRNKARLKRLHLQFSFI